jgi:hypothetical protein
MDACDVNTVNISTTLAYLERVDAVNSFVNSFVKKGQRLAIITETCVPL